MRLRLSDIDPGLARRVREREAQAAVIADSFGGVSPLPRLVRRRATAEQGMRTLFGAVALLATFVLHYLLVVTTRWQWPPLLGLFTAAVPGLTLYAILSRHYGGRLRHQYEHLLLRELLSQVPQTRAERTYAEIISLLTERGPSGNGHSEKESRSLLSQMNALMQAGSELEAQEKKLRASAAPDQVAALQSEREQLERRRDAAADPVARQALAQSLELCSARLEGARRLGPVRERVQAQQEFVAQTLLTLQGALAHRDAVPEGGGPSVSLPQAAAQVQEVVAQINNQTRAVEEAVQEVLTPRAR